MAAAKLPKKERTQMDERGSVWRIWDSYQVDRLPGFVKAMRIGPDVGGGIVVDDEELLLRRDDANFILDALNSHARLTEENTRYREGLKRANTQLHNIRLDRWHNHDLDYINLAIEHIAAALVKGEAT